MTESTDRPGPANDRMSAELLLNYYSRAPIPQDGQIFAHGWLAGGGRGELEFARYLGGKGTPFVSYELSIQQDGGTWVPYHGSVAMSPQADLVAAANSVMDYWHSLPLRDRLTSDNYQALRGQTQEDLGTVMRVDIHEARGAVLNWLVAQCEGQPRVFEVLDGTSPPEADYVGDPQLAQRIIEREGLACYRWVQWPAERWWATKYDKQSQPVSRRWGPTKEIAAMRCFVSARLGSEVLVPRSLVANAQLMSQVAKQVGQVVQNPAAPDQGALLRNVLHKPATLPFYIWANEDCSNTTKSWPDAKALRMELINGGCESVYILDAAGVEVVDAEIAAHETLVQAGYIVGPNNGEVQLGRDGAFAVFDPRFEQGWKVVLAGDDLGELVAAACDKLQLPVEQVQARSGEAEHLRARAGG